MGKPNHLSPNLKLEIVGIFLVSVSLLIFICLINPSVGILASYISMLLKTLAGEGRFLFPVAVGISGLRLIQNSRKKVVCGPVHGFLLLLLVVLTLLHFPIPLDYSLQAGWRGDGGGLIGGLANFMLQKSFGRTGACIILFTITIIGVLILANRSIKTLYRDFCSVFIGFVENVRDQRGYLVHKTKTKGNKKKQEPVIVDFTDSVEDCYEEQAASIEQVYNVIDHNERFSDTGEGINFELRDISSGKVKKQDDFKFISSGVYQLPLPGLFTRPPKPRHGKKEMNINESVRKLEDTLESFGIKARIGAVSRGPAITRYEIQPPPGIRVSKIASLADDIALSMAAPDVRIEAPIPGKSAMGIEVPNREISMVYLRELIEAPDFTKTPGRLTLALGKDVAGKPVIADLVKMPHLLIAGATGSGKSVCLNTIIASVLFKALPSEVKFLIIDPKMVELATYNGIPHLVSPVVTDSKKAATSLRWAVKEMEHRYELFAGAGVRDIYRYNHQVVERREVDLALPLMMIIIDELADLMMVAPADVEDSICRLAQMSRAAGMHLVIATQRPSVDVITGLIKANIPSRISFAVSSQIDSRTILDMGGAEKLLGKGDMLFYPVGAAKPLRVQGAYLSDQDVDNLVSYLKRQAVPEYNEKFVGNELGIENEQYEDELLPRAIQIIIESGYASISMLQRRLRVGYSRAARLIDIMERKGIVGGYVGSKPRSVLITREQYEKTQRTQGE